MLFAPAFISISVISVFLEIIFIFIENFLCAKGTPAIIKFISRSLMVVCTICAAVILFICLRICIDMFMTGDIEKAVKMLITSLIAAIGGYILFLHRFIGAYLKKNKI